MEDILDLYEEYCEEMSAQGAWSGHAYAATYFSNLRAKLIKALNALSNEHAKRAMFQISDDYDELITLIYKSEIESPKKELIADALDQAFLNKLDNCFQELNEQYNLENAYLKKQLA